MLRPAPTHRPIAVLAAAALCAALGCGTAGTPRGAEPATGAGPFPVGPPPPAHGLALPTLDVHWSPARVTGGDLTELATLLAGRDVAVLAAPAGWLSEPAAGASVAGALAALAPQTRWLTPQASSLADAAGPWPATAGSTAADLSGVEIDPTWAERMAGAQTQPADRPEAIVLVDHAPITAEAWNARPVRTVGGCDAVDSALAAGQEHGLAEVEPFVAHVDGLLSQIYRPSVAALSPLWLEELAQYEEPGEPTPERACGQAYLAHVRAVAACAEGAGPSRDVSDFRDAADAVDGPDCLLAPRVFLHGGLRIGIAPSDAPPLADDCPALVGRDYIAASRRLATEAAEAVAGTVDARWLQLADRVGALTEVHAVLAEVCAPQRRRLAQDDLAIARQRLAQVGDALSSDLVSIRAGRFESSLTPFHVPGVGLVTPVATYDGGPASVAKRAIADTRALAQWLRTRSRCRGDADATPWAVLTADAVSAAPLLLTYVYPEQLTCSGMPPAL